MIKQLNTLHGSIPLPTFFPDGTLGVVRGVDSTDLEKYGVEGLVINTYHLLYQDLSKKIDQFKDVHSFMRWPHPIITDSGGFQVMSLIHENPGSGKITDEGVVFHLSRQKRTFLTPENSIQTQLALGTDIAIVLDDCTYSEISLKDQEKSVERTVAWAKRSKDEFEKLLRSQALPDVPGRPLLFGVVQGGNDQKLREYCAKELIKIGFDGYCFGGFPVDKKGQFLSEILNFTAKLLPDDKIKYALGVGKPENIVECFKMGYGLFDCVIPTREARHKKLYIFNSDPKKVDLFEEKFYSNINIGQGRYEKDGEVISKFCDCLTCQNYSRAYLHYLFKIGDSLAVRLATVHNLRFYTQLMEKLKEI